MPTARLAFAGYVGQVESVFTANPDGTDRKLLSSTASNQHWSPDRRHLSVVAPDRQGLLFVGLVDPDGSHYVQFDSPDPSLNLGCFAWSPDGVRLACEGWDDADLTRNGLYTVSAIDGGDLIRVTTSPGGAHDIPADYSPDGDQIVFTRHELPDDTVVTLMVVSAAGGAARPETTGGLAGGRLSPDGKTILTVEHGSIELVPLDGGPVTSVALKGGTNLNPEGPAWSPDGEWIAFSGHSGTGFDLYIVRTDGTDLSQVTHTPGAWEGEVEWR